MKKIILPTWAIIVLHIALAIVYTTLIRFLGPEPLRPAAIFFGFAILVSSLLISFSFDNYKKHAFAIIASIYVCYTVSIILLLIFPDLPIGFLPIFFALVPIALNPWEFGANNAIACGFIALILALFGLVFYLQETSPRPPVETVKALVIESSVSDENLTEQQFFPGDSLILEIQSGNVKIKNNRP